ncbi:dihydrofolate reductase family protein [Nocardiopsis aegyptia]|uniref:dihydrofolate reductase family protein n=1 Tax=Nocardiopsis aegyptia TaxID=220378 RepID=UPI003671FC6F
MRRIVTGLFTSLDGVVEADGDWQYPWFDDELFTVIGSAWGKAGALLLGRRSFEGYERLRTEHPDSPVLPLFDATPTYVVSTTLAPSSQRENVTVIGDDLPRRIASLREEGEGEVLVMGSPSLVRWLVSHRLLDELAMVVLPVVAGPGARLFDGMPAGPVPLRLIRSRALGSGALDLGYVPEAAPND